MGLLTRDGGEQPLEHVDQGANPRNVVPAHPEVFFPEKDCDCEQRPCPEGKGVRGEGNRDHSPPEPDRPLLAGSDGRIVAAAAAPGIALVAGRASHPSKQWPISGYIPRIIYTMILQGVLTPYGCRVPCVVRGIGKKGGVPDFASKGT